MATTPITISPDNLKGIFYTDPIEKHYIPHIMEEIFKQRVYDPFFYNKKDMVVLDMGANIGLFSLYAAPHAKVVYAIEPSAEHQQTLQHMLKYNGLSNVHPYALAISHQTGTATFNHSPNVTAYSLRDEIHQMVPDAGTEQVATMRIDEFFVRERIFHVDFMKMDIEGSEFEVIMGEGFKKVADKIDALVVELHAWPGVNYNLLITTLADLGFDKIEQMATDAFVISAQRRLK
jgi:FkbM family methyltransferase